MTDYKVSQPCGNCGGKVFYLTSHKLLKAESLDPKDSVTMEACARCGTTREQR